MVVSSGSLVSNGGAGVAVVADGYIAVVCDEVDDSAVGDRCVVSGEPDKVA